MLRYSYTPKIPFSIDEPVKNNAAKIFIEFNVTPFNHKNEKQIKAKQENKKNGKIKQLKHLKYLKNGAKIGIINIVDLFLRQLELKKKC